MERDNSNIMALPRFLWLSSSLNKVNPNNPPSIYIPIQSQSMEADPAELKLVWKEEKLTAFENPLWQKQLA
jgi:hypothetical protein